MHASEGKSFAATAAAIFVLAVLLTASAAPPRLELAQTAAPAAPDLVFSLDPTQSKVQWTLDTTLHTVHGTFHLQNGTLQFNPQTGKASGGITVLATSGESGNSSRDEKMHKEVLQSAKFSTVVFRPSQIEGTVPSSGACDVKLHGVLSLHGADHELIIPVHAEITASQWKGTASFPVPFIQWGLKDPSNFFLKVKPVVDIHLDLSGSLKPAP
jgi:polyisoprenoid-binding protein YceI